MGRSLSPIPGPGQGSREVRRPRPEVGSVPGGWTMNCIGTNTYNLIFGDWSKSRPYAEVTVTVPSGVRLRLVDPVVSDGRETKSFVGLR